MVQNIIKLSERENRIVNVVKAKNGMKNKNQALGFIIQTFAKEHLPEMMTPMENPKRPSAKKEITNLEELRTKIRE